MFDVPLHEIIALSITLDLAKEFDVLKSVSWNFNQFFPLLFIMEAQTHKNDSSCSFQFIPFCINPILLSSSRPPLFHQKVFPFSWPSIVANKIIIGIRPPKFDTISKFIHKVSSCSIHILCPKHFKHGIWCIDLWILLSI
jgi:hypothetical protein